jgi:hypothetical protein
VSPEKASSSQVACGNVVTEALPWPVVHYPNLRGTFCAFARSMRSAPALCACAESAVRNLLGLRPALRMRRANGESPASYFPDPIARKIAAWNGRGDLPVQFRPALCHRCNAAIPTFRYCNDHDDTPFVQQYGWYLNQAYLRLGILPYRNAYLPGVCPADYQADIETSRNLEREFQRECDRLLEVVDLSALPGNGPRDAILLRPAWRHQFGQMIELRRQASEQRKVLKRKIQAIVAQEFRVAGYAAPTTDR